MEDVKNEIERLKIRKVELVNRANIINDNDEKENIRSEIDRIESQIKTLERVLKK